MVVEQQVVFQADHPKLGDVVGVLVGVGKEVGGINLGSQKINVAVAADAEDAEFASLRVAEVYIESQVFVSGSRFAKRSM